MKDDLGSQPIGRRDDDVAAAAVATVVQVDVGHGAMEREEMWSAMNVSFVSQGEKVHI